MFDHQWELKRRCQARGVSVWGNIELKLLEQGTPGQVRAEVRKIMSQAKAGGGFVLMPTAGPINVPLAPKTEANYKAFIADPDYLNRETRSAQPWELRLTLKDGKVSGVLTYIEQIWRDDAARPDLKSTDYEVGSPEALRQALDKHGPGIPVILVIAQPAVTHGQLMAFIAPVRRTHPTIHVYLR